MRDPAFFEPGGSSRPRDASEAQLVAAVRAALVPGALLPPPEEESLDEGQAHASGAAIDLVQREVHRYVAWLRSSGATPERVLISVKELLRPTLSRTASAAARGGGPAPLDRVVEWAIAAYYRVD